MDAGQTLRGWHKGTAGNRALPECCLIIPTYRRPETVVALLRRLDELPDAPAEVVIVDGSPDPATGEAVRAWAKDGELPFELKYVASPAGLTRQRNVGIDASTKELVFFLDDDCLPEPGYFQKICQVFHDDTKNSIGAVRGFITNVTNRQVSWVWRLRARLGIVGTELGKYYSTGMTWTWHGVAPFPGTRPVDVLAGGAAAYRRTVFAQYRFSEFFSGYSAGEDVEMSRRIAQDWSLVVCGDALVEHRRAAGGRPGGFAFGRMAVRNRVFIWRRHSPQIAFDVWIKFWLDQALVAGRELAWCMRGPQRGGYFQRFLGTLCGGVECLVAPPRYWEPPARREYEFELPELADSCRAT